jgi:hypothetical protein
MSKQTPKGQEPDLTFLPPQPQTSVNNKMPLQDSAFPTLYCFMNKVIGLTDRTSCIEMEDLFKADPSMLYDEDFGKFRALWKKMRGENADCSIFKVLFGHIKWTWYKVILCELMAAAAELMIPMLILWFLEWYGDKDAAGYQGWMYAGIITTLYWIKAFFKGGTGYFIVKIITSVNNNIRAILFEKVLTVKPEGRVYLDNGKLTTI